MLEFKLINILFDDQYILFFAFLFIIFSRGRLSEDIGL